MPPNGAVDWKSPSKLVKLRYKPRKAVITSPQWCRQISPMFGKNSEQRRIRKEQSYHSPLIHLARGPVDICSTSLDDSVVILENQNTSLASDNLLQRSSGKKRSVSPADSVIILSDNEAESSAETKTIPKRVQLKIPRIPKARLSSKTNTRNLRPIPIVSKNENRSGLRNIKTVTTSKKVRLKIPELSISRLGSETHTTELQPISIDSEDENTIPKDGVNSSVPSQDAEIIVVDNPSRYETHRNSSTVVKPGIEEDAENVEADLRFTGTQIAAEQLMSIKKRPNLKTPSFVIDTKGDFTNLRCMKQAIKKRKKQLNSKQSPNWDRFITRQCTKSLHKMKLTTVKHQPEADEIRGDCAQDKDLSSGSSLLRVPYVSTNQPKVNEIGNNSTKVEDSFGVSLALKVPQEVQINQREGSKIGNYYTPDIVSREPGSLREIVIDGCNIAMAYTNNRHFSEDGLRLVLRYFQLRGHTVKVFVPQHQRSMARNFLEYLYKQGIAVFTPSRSIGGKRIVSYDDRFILDYATLCDGIVVSRDQYRDLYTEKEQWKHIIENRLLMPTFVGNCVMFPEDPLGKFGPSLEQFLRH